MSKLGDTKRAYDRVKSLLDQELLKKHSNAQQIRECQAAVDVAFYLLGWGHFEYLTRKAAEDRMKGEARGRTVHGTAWRFVLENIKRFSVRDKLEVVFHARPAQLKKLKGDYEVRNEAARNYKTLPPEVGDISAWLEHLEDLVNNF
jgi:hypothetical protein